MGQDQKCQHQVKHFLFDILSLSNQLYRSPSKVLEDSGQRHIYFSKNSIADFVHEKIGNLATFVSLFNQWVI